MLSFILIPLMLASVESESSLEKRHPDAIELYYCDFSEQFDQNYDLWPDEWTRQTGPGYPRYLDIELDEKEAFAGKKSLKLELDGGAATVYSQPIEVRDIFSYVLEGRLKTEGLDKNRAYYTVSFYDNKEQLIETIESRHFRDSDGWTKIRLGPIVPKSPDINLAVIGMHLIPVDEQDEDLTGRAWFDDIWLARLPKMTLQTVGNKNVFTDPNDIKILCNVSGILERDPEMRFELRDVTLKMIDETAEKLEGQIVARKSNRASELFGKSIHTSDGVDVGYAGTISWDPEITKYGFYEVVTTMRGAKGVMAKRTMSLAVVPEETPPQGGIFGWSLPDGEAPLDLQTMTHLLTNVGVNWVKFPVWFDEADEKRATDVAKFIERLKKNHIEMVAIVDKPPEKIRPLFGEGESLVAASVFADPLLWKPYLEPVLTRLSLKIKYWQLGADNDISFVGYRNLVAKLAQIKKELKSSGHDVRLGISWRWMSDDPSGTGQPWNFLSYSILPQSGNLAEMIPLSKDELGTYLDHNQGKGNRFVTIYPLPRSRYNTNERARDLLEKMLAAKIHNAEAVFIPKPFDREYGLMNEDGSPSELLLPWRTTAMMISGSEFLGSIQLPNGSQNYIFSRDGKTVMVVWNQRETEEVIYLGDDVAQVDLWGRHKVPARSKEEGSEHRQIIKVGPIPSFVSGLNEGVARVRMSFKFNTTKLRSDFGTSQKLKLAFDNPFSQGMNGTVTLVGPKKNWEVTPKTSKIKLPRGGKFDAWSNLVLGSDASSGVQPARIDFDISSDSNYKFSVHREFQVGSGQVSIDTASSHFDKLTGNLVVEITLINRGSDQVTFDCALNIPGKRELRQRVLRLGRGSKKIVFQVRDAKGLANSSLLLRCKEIGGKRVLNYRVETPKLKRRDWKLYGWKLGDWETLESNLLDWKQVDWSPLESKLLEWKVLKLKPALLPS
ncbi:MAG: hypothetical protein COA78_01665 [Blastopirellula sp.]|nr:MAG: hypothetical protein COA78_01665 [Blastopirellula sp.]